MKNKKYKNALKFIPLAAILTLILSLLFACGGDSGGNDTGDKNLPADDGKSSGQADDSKTQDEEDRILPDLPEANYDGHEFKILTFGVQGSEEWEQIDLTVKEEDAGDVVSDAVYRRNAAVEGKYNISLKEVHIYDSEFGNAIKKDFGAGTNEYDLISPRVVDSAGYMQSGYFLNLFNPAVEYLDLSKPWYNQQAIKEMSIDNKLFIVLSDVLLSDNNATCITLFNKKIIQDHGLGDMYSLVREGKWTVDKLYEYSKVTARDLNSDGKMTPAEDRFGYLIWGDAMITYLHSAGQRLVSKDENDLPVLSFNDAKTYEAMEKVMDLLYDENVTGNVQKDVFDNWSKIAFQDIFSSGRAAFGWCRLFMVPNLRGMDDDFGILPIPKIYESSDTNYHSTVNVHTSCALAIPAVCKDTDRTTIIMEALAAESKYTIQPAYYDIALYRKHSRDEDSREMLDIILSNRVLDIGDVYNFAEFGIEFYRRAKDNDRSLVAFYEKYESKVNKEIDKLIGRIQDLP